MEEVLKFRSASANEPGAKSDGVLRDLGVMIM